MEINLTRKFGRPDVRRASRICSRAFQDAPHVAHFFPDEASRARNAVELFRMRIRYGLQYGEVHTLSPDVEGLAVWLPSENAAMSMWKQIRAGGMRLYRTVGSDAVARMTHVAEHNDHLRLQYAPGKHWFLSILAVDPDQHGRGFATSLLDPMLARLDREELPAYAETTERELLAFYQRFGFEPGTESTVPGTDLTVWPLVRRTKTREADR